MNLPSKKPTPTGQERRNLYACLFTGVILLMAVCLTVFSISASLWVLTKAWTLLRS